MQRHKLVRGGNKASSSRLPRRFVTCNHDQRKAALVDDVEAGGRGGGDATFGMTVITLMKICVGTGVLAVPHAFSGAGVVPGFGMLFALLCWNDWSANRLLACRDLLSDDERRRFEAPGGEVAAGRIGASSRAARGDVRGGGRLHVDDADVRVRPGERLRRAGLCFGVAPLALQLEASMAEPRRFASAQRYALGVAFLAYAATGAGVARLYDGLPCAPDGVAGNVLDDLPRGAPWTTAPSAVRVAMSVVCVFSAPIGVVSSGEILEAALPPLAPGRRPLFLRRLAVRAAWRSGRDGRGGVPVFALIVALRSRWAATVLGVVVVVFTTSLTALTTAAEVARAAAPPPVVQSG
ncbi:hypothetical protein JL720_4459 [Aureococcus anophagefferens]|nr:hypothetical protein JL720_4459 [Aureococcus anophagefferens]